METQTANNDIQYTLYSIHYNYTIIEEIFCVFVLSAPLSDGSCCR